jgi:hypothetical protein
MNIVGVWEFSLGIYLIAEGFRPDATPFARERRSAVADDRTFSVRQPVAADGAAVVSVPAARAPKASSAAPDARGRISQGRPVVTGGNLVR